MSILRGLLLGLLALGVLPLHAEERSTAPDMRVIPRTYISPGASGSVDSYQRGEQYDLYSGQRLPRVDSWQRNQSGSSQIRQWGGIRQSTEYPNGQRIERFPGTSTEQREERH